MEEDDVDLDERRPRMCCFGGKYPLLLLFAHVIFAGSERDRRIQPEGELSDSEDEGEGDRRDHQDWKQMKPLNEDMEVEMVNEVKAETTDGLSEVPIQTTLEGGNVNTDGPPSAMRDEPLSPPSSS